MCNVAGEDGFVAFQVFFPFAQEYIEMLMPPLIEKWNALKDEDKDLFPLLEVRYQPTLLV